PGPAGRVAAAAGQHGPWTLRRPQAGDGSAALAGRPDRRRPADRHGQGLAGWPGRRRGAAGGGGGGRGGRLLQAPVGRFLDVVGILIDPPRNAAKTAGSAPAVFVLGGASRREASARVFPSFILGRRVACRGRAWRAGVPAL